MRRVRIVHTLRPFTGRLAGAFVLLGASLYMLGREVFVAQVFRNMPYAFDLSSVLTFLEAAFLNTTFFVQAFFILAFIAFIWLVRECTRLLITDQQQLA